jgi:hypothetical protein
MLRNTWAEHSPVELISVMCAARLDAVYYFTGP